MPGSLGRRPTGPGPFANGQRAGLTTPGGSQSYLYDAAGHLLSHTTPLGTASWTYDALGRTTAGILPNGARTTYAYGPGSVLATLTNQDPALATLSQFTNFTFNGQGQLTGFSAAVPGVPGLSGSQGWTYDILGRMQSDSSTRYGGWNDSYAYDELGNITNWRGAARMYNAANQETDAAFVYDGNGNPLTYKGETLTYNVFDGLTQYADDLTCGYRSDGLRAWKAPGGGGTTGGTGRTYYLYDGPGIACELDATGAVTAALPPRLPARGRTAEHSRERRQDAGTRRPNHKHRARPQRAGNAPVRCTARISYPSVRNRSPSRFHARISTGQPVGHDPGMVLPGAANSR